MSSPAPLIDYVCLLSNETEPFARTCGLDFLSPTPVLVGQVHHRCPSYNHSEVEFPDCLELFVYPTGLAFQQLPPPAQTHSFVLTLVSGARVYGYCHTQWVSVPAKILSVIRMQMAERMMRSEDSELAPLPSSLYTPQSLCLLSRHSFHSAFFALLNAVIGDRTIDSGMADALYGALSRLSPTLSLGSPLSKNSSRSRSPSRTSPSRTLSRTRSLTLTVQLASLTVDDSDEGSVSRQVMESLRMIVPSLSFSLPSPPFDTAPVIDSASLSLLFAHIAPTDLITVINLILCETSILVVSEHLHLLTPILESLQALLYPMKWPYIYIPVLPLTLTDFFQAPQPFLIGAHRDALTAVTDDLTVAIVDLDHSSLDVRHHVAFQLSQSQSPPSPLASPSSSFTTNAYFPLPYSLQWRLYHLIVSTCPIYVILHAGRESLKPPVSLPQSSLPTVAYQSPTVSIRDVCDLTRLDASHCKRAVMSIETCQLLHSGTEGEEQENNELAYHYEPQRLSTSQHGLLDEGNEDEVDIEEDEDASSENDDDSEHNSDGEVGEGETIETGDEYVIHKPITESLMAVESMERSRSTPSPSATSALPLAQQSPVAIEIDTVPAFSLPSSVSRLRQRSSDRGMMLQPVPRDHRGPMLEGVQSSSPVQTPITGFDDTEHSLPQSQTVASVNTVGQAQPTTPQSAHTVTSLHGSRSFDTPTKHGLASRTSLTHASKWSSPFTLSRDMLPSPSQSSNGASNEDSMQPTIFSSPHSFDHLDAPVRSPFDNDGRFFMSSARVTKLRRGFLSVFVSLMRHYETCINSTALPAGGTTPKRAGSRTGQVSEVPVFTTASTVSSSVPPSPSSPSLSIQTGMEPSHSASSIDSNSDVTFDGRRFLSLSDPHYENFLIHFAQSQTVKYFLQQRSQSQLVDDTFTLALRKSNHRHSIRHSYHLQRSRVGPLYKLGHALPVWRERWFELSRYGLTLRFFSYNQSMLDAEKRYRELKQQWKLSPNDRILKASLDRAAESRERLRRSLLKGSIQLEAGHTNIEIPNTEGDRRRAPQPWCFELSVRDTRWLFCAGDSHSRDEWIRCIRARVGPMRTSAPVLCTSSPSQSHHSHSGTIGNSYADSELQTQLRWLREQSMMAFQAHIQEKLQTLTDTNANTSAAPITPTNAATNTNTYTGAGSDSLTLKSLVTPKQTTRRSLPNMAHTAVHSHGSVTSTLTSPSNHVSTAMMKKELSASLSSSQLSRCLLCAELMLRHLDIRDRQQRWRTHAKSFIGREAVDWLVQAQLVTDRAQGVELCSHLLTLIVIVPIDANNSNASTNSGTLLPFNDDDSLYTFTLLRSQSSTDTITTTIASVTAEDKLILRELQSSLDLGTHHSGLLLLTPHSDCFRGSACLAWLIDQAIVHSDSDARRWCNRMLAAGEIVAVNQSSDKQPVAKFNDAGLYRFRATAVATSDTSTDTLSP